MDDSRGCTVANALNESLPISEELEIAMPEAQESEIFFLNFKYLKSVKLFDSNLKYIYLPFQISLSLLKLPKRIVMKTSSAIWKETGAIRLRSKRL